MATVKKKPTKKPAAATAAEVKAWRAATQAVTFKIEVLTGDGVQTVSGGTTLPAGTWFAVVPQTPSTRRYHYVMQWQGKTKKFVLVALTDGAGATRLPAAGGWSRALDTGKLHVIASDLLLTRSQIATLIGGHEPGTGVAKPPNT